VVTGAVFCSVLGSQAIHAQTLDTLTFGNTTSESAHSLTTAFGAVTPASVVSAGGGVTPSNPSSTNPSQTVTGALSQAGRQLLPRTPNADIYGGQMTFTMTVDPVQQNYLTVKFWGSDTNTDEWLVLDVNGYELGARHGGAGVGLAAQSNTEGDMFWNYSGGWYPNRWIYRTLPLPLNLTQGQTTVTLTVRSLGLISYYASGAYFDNYQELMNSPSPVLYEAVTHTTSYFNASSETQGTAPAAQTPLTSPSASATISTIESKVNSQTQAYLADSAGSLTPFDLEYLAEVYGTSWSTYKGSAAIVAQVVAGMDALVTAYAAAPATYMGSFGDSSWGGYLGTAGDAIRLLWTQINTGTTMSTTVAYGGSLGTVSRTTAWSTALRASLDYGRFNRRGITNQSIFEAMNIYLANRGLELVQSSNALNESEALRYLNESCGISPWMGSDQAGEGPVPVYGTAPNGPTWYMMTSAGTSKEIGFVGSDYGEVGGEIYRMGIVSGNAALQARALVLLQARDYFRYTGLDANNYLIMYGTNPVGVRNNQEMPGNTPYPGAPAWLGRGTSDDFLLASRGASVIGSNLLGYFQQGVSQGQIWPKVESWGYDTYYGVESLPVLIPDYWTAASAQAQTGVLLPETNGASLPNFAWADAQNMVVAAKYGSGSAEENFFANLFWREPNYINGYAKVFDLTASQARVADVMLQDEPFDSTGITLLGSNVTDVTSEPWDDPTMATAGVPYMEAIRSDLTTLPTTNQDGGRGTGYTLRWGHWLVGMNAYQTSTGTTYAMKMSSDFTSGTDLISGQTFTGQITLQPQTAVVFYMTDTVDPNPAPGRVLYLGAGSGDNGTVPLTWAAAAGANDYTVLRSTTSGGPYTVVANGITTLQYLDNTVTNGTTYYYVVASYNTAGVTGGNSPQASATPAAAETAGLPPPWTNVDVGTVGAAGSATYSGGAFTLQGSGTGVTSTADAFQYVDAPLNGNGSLTVKVVSQTNTLASAPAGITVRQSLNPDDLNVSLYLMPSDGVTMTRRTALADTTYTVASEAGIKAPYWLQLAFTAGNVFTGSISPDGVNWTVLGTTVLASWTGLSTIGMVDSSKVSATLSTDVFSNVTLTGVPTNSAAAVPSGLTATPGVGQVSLRWTAVSGATAYNLKRATTSGGPYTTVAASTAATSYVDAAVVAGTTYFYVVSSLNSVGDSGNSSQVSATPTQTMLTVTAANASRFFDTANPAFTYTMTGFNAGDTQASSTSGAPSLTTSALQNSPAGGYAIVASTGTLASAKYTFQFVNGTLMVTGNAPQQIVFPPLPALATVSTLRLAAAASSGLPVTFTVSGPATIYGSLLTATGTGTVMVTASQAGNSTYAAAPTVTRTFTVQ
jgi:fibronectin type 3 domain-containing protein